MQLKTRDQIVKFLSELKLRAQKDVADQSLTREELINRIDHYKDMNSKYNSSQAHHHNINGHRIDLRSIIHKLEEKLASIDI